jgi:addiction module HigA family antidote
MKNPAHPGTFIRDITEELGVSITDGAAALGVPHSALSDLVDGRVALSPDMAVRLETAFGVSGETLMRMQTNFDIAQADSPS